MKEMMKGTQGTAKVMLALLGGILMPILIWVALGVAICQKVRRAPQRKTSPTIGEVLSIAGLAIHGETATRAFRVRSASEINKILARAGMSLQDTGRTAHTGPKLTGFKPTPKRA